MWKTHWDHCHITWKYRGAAHWSFNTNLKLSKSVPVIFHCLKGYESRAIMNNLIDLMLK